MCSLDGKLKWITASKRTIWGVNKNDDIFTAEDIKFDFTGNIHFTRKHIDGKLKQIRVYDLSTGMSKTSFGSLGKSLNIVLLRAADYPCNQFEV